MISRTVNFDSDTDKKGLYSLLKALKGSYVIELKKYRKNRSVRENSYYWGVIIKELCSFTGFQPDEMHEVLKMKFLRDDKTIRATGELVPGFKSTKTLNTAEFEAYCEAIRVFALADLDCYIPLPNELIY